MVSFGEGRYSVSVMWWPLLQRLLSVHKSQKQNLSEPRVNLSGTKQMASELYQPLMSTASGSNVKGGLLSQDSIFLAELEAKKTGLGLIHTFGYYN